MAEGGGLLKVIDLLGSTVAALQLENDSLRSERDDFAGQVEALSRALTEKPASA